MNETEREDIKCALEIAKEKLEAAHIACSELADLLENYGAGENGGAGTRMQRYIVPSLETWLSDPRQIGSLAAIEEELQQEDSEVDDEIGESPFGGFDPEAAKEFVRDLRKK